ncbi:YTH domain-containing protein [Drosera capensis]
MAAVIPSPDPAGLMQNLSLDSQTKSKANVDLSEPTKKVHPFEAPFDPNSAQSYVAVSNQMATTYPYFGYAQNGYPYAGYYVQGYDEAGNYGDQKARYPHQDLGYDVPSGGYGDDATLVYHHGYGYVPYVAPMNSSVPAVGHENQFYGHFPFQYQSPFLPVSTSGVTHTPAGTRQGEWSHGAASVIPYTSETANNNASFTPNYGVKGTNGSAPYYPSYQNPSFTANNSYGHGGLPSSSYQDARFGYDRMMSPVSWLGDPVFSDGQPMPVISNSFSSSVPQGLYGPAYRRQNLRPQLNTMGLHQPRPYSGMGNTRGFFNKTYPSKIFGQYGNVMRSGGYGYTAFDAHTGGRGLFTGDIKYKNRGRGNGLFNSGNDVDGMNELSKGPRTKSSKNQTVAPTSFAVEGESNESKGDHDNRKDNLDAVLETETYSRPDFTETYADAKFFIIKSYSEDDVHKSIKYSVWSSTPNGNKKLDAAYQEAQAKPDGCPVFLFFSVNTSGQFVGMAEMVGPVDFHKNVEYWQQDKWNGCFPVKWHIVKDVPNTLLKHITLEYNENKSVTNSRDTQEVELEEGLQMLKIFKDHVSDTSILVDFEFYEERQKNIQEKKAKQQQFQKQAGLYNFMLYIFSFFSTASEGKYTSEKDTDEMKGDLKSVESVDTHDSTKETSLTLKSDAEGKQLDAGLPTENNDAPNNPKL